MSRLCVAEVLEQLEGEVRHHCELVVRHRHWVERARDWRSLGDIDRAAACLLRAAERRAFYIKSRSRVKRLKAEILEACHD